MRKLFLFGFMFIAGMGCVQAQKVAYFNSTALLTDLPSIKHVDSALVSFADALKGEYAYLQDEYKTKSEKLKDTTSMSEVKKTLLKQDVEGLINKLNSFQNTATQQMTNKRNELLAPINKKVYAIVEEIAKENKYDVVLDITSTPIYYAPKSFDITELIKKKIK